MKTHELARLLIGLARDTEPSTHLNTNSRLAVKQLAELLEDAPNVPIGELRIGRRSDEIAVGLKVLSSLSKYTKQQWLQVASDHGIDLQLNSRDSARDVLGKVLRYLDAHPDVVKSLGTRVRRSTKVVDTSELENALTKLLERKDG